MKTKISGFRFNDEILKLIDQYQEQNHMVTRTDALRHLILRYVKPNPKQISEPTTQAVSIPQAETQAGTEIDTKIKCPFSNRPGDFWRCRKCAKTELQRFNDCTTIFPDWKQDIIRELEEEAEEKRQREEELGGQDQDYPKYENEAKPEDSQKEEETQTPQKEEIRKQCRMDTSERLVTESYCRKECEQPELIKKICYVKMWPENT